MENGQKRPAKPGLGRAKRAPQFVDEAFFCPFSIFPQTCVALGVLTRLLRSVCAQWAPRAALERQNACFATFCPPELVGVCGVAGPFLAECGF